MVSQDSTNDNVCGDVTRSNCRCMACVMADMAAHLKEHHKDGQIIYTLLTVGPTSSKNSKSEFVCSSNYGVKKSVELMNIFIDKHHEIKNVKTDENPRK